MLHLNIQNSLVSVAERGVWWLSGRVLDSRLSGCGFQASLEALHCVLEQDTLSSA